jgi:Tfp pilus assembly protein PilF
MSRFECRRCHARVSEFDGHCPACGETSPELSAGDTSTTALPSRAPAAAPTVAAPARPRAPRGAPAADDAPLPRVIGRYEVEGRLGAGGMGVVYRAVDRAMGRAAAVKVLSAELAHDPVAEARFLREAQTASRLDHPAIAPVYEVGEHDGRLFIAMALCEGETLKARILRGPLPLGEALGIAAQIAGALAAAHEAGVVHRDVKPANVMIAPPRAGEPARVRLLDFGIAKLAPGGAAAGAAQLTETGELVGTPAYMSPEHVRGEEEVDHRTDLWALGAILHEMLTGRSPFAGRGGTYAEVFRVLTDPPASLRDHGVEAPEALQRVLASLLEKRREDRCPSAREALAALEAIARGEEAAPVPTPPPAVAATPPLAARGPSRRRGSAVAAAIVALSIAAGAGGVALARRRGQPVPAAASTGWPPPSGAALGPYQEGLEKLRRFDVLGAEALLSVAAARDPSSAAVEASLADARSRLGRDADARAAADRAIELAAGLGREDRLSIEASARASSQEWDQAAGLYRALQSFFPDRLDYGLGLATAQTRGGHGKQAAATIEDLRRAPHAAADDARLDLAEAGAALTFADHLRALAAAARAAEEARKQGAKLVSAEALLLSGEADIALDALDAAAGACAEARAILEEAGDTHGVGRALTCLALVARGRGAYDAQRALLEEALALSKRTGDRRNAARALNDLAIVARKQGDDERARRLYEEAIAGDRAAGDRMGAAVSLGNLGAALSSAADLDGARRAFEEALATFRAEGNESESARMLTNLGGVAKRAGDLGRARELREEALGVAQKLGQKGKQASYLAAVARVVAAEGDLAGARSRFEAAAALQDGLGAKVAAAELRLELAGLSLDEGRPEDALATAAAASEVLPAEDRVELETVLARATLALGRVAEAADHASRAQAALAPHAAVYDRLELALAGAEVAAAEGRRADAARAFAEVLAETDRRGLVDLGFFARLTRDGADLRYGDAAAARADLAALERDARARGFLLVAERAAALRGSKR